MWPHSKVYRVSQNYGEFNFACWGVPCHITGIVVSMAASQMLQLRYENVGSPDAKLVLYRSKLMPLMKVGHLKNGQTRREMKT